MNTIEHAKLEFKYAGYTPLDQAQEEDPNKWIQENVLELLEVFSKQGHSGSSAPYCINMFERLAKHKPLGPIKCTEDEWNNVTDTTYQNKRLSAVFKEGKNGRPYYLDAIVFKDQEGSCYTGSALMKDGSETRSRQLINLPFTPKTFYIDVIGKEVAKDDWEHYVKDESQLDEVFKYYKK